MRNGDDFRILRDETIGPVRYVSAEPSALVCSKQIDFKIVDGCLHDVVYTRGCNGNLQAIGRLLEGMSVKEAAETLRGVDCNFRGTSCTDQLVRVLDALPK